MEQEKRIATYQPWFDENPIVLSFKHDSIAMSKGRAKQLLNELTEIFKNIDET